MTVTVSLPLFYFCLGIFVTLFSQFVFLMLWAWNYAGKK